MMHGLTLVMQLPVLIHLAGFISHVIMYFLKKVYSLARDYANNMQKLSVLYVSLCLCFILFLFIWYVVDHVDVFDVVVRDLFYYNVEEFLFDDI